jgi:DNA-binding transcriptional LysR family regulator
MNINFEAFKIFYIVAVNKSISKAAEVLFVSQPAVTWQIKTLERQLDTMLFIRTKHGVEMTSEGRALFEYVKNGVESFNNGINMLTNLKNLDNGFIHIGASTTVSKFVLMPYLALFHELYPKIDIQIINTLTENLLIELRAGNLDMLILNLPMRENKDLNIIKVADVEDIFVGNKKFFDLTHGKTTLEELKYYPLIFQKLPSNTRVYLDDYLKENNVRLSPAMEVVSFNLIMDFVKSGFGIGYATKEFIEKEIENKELFEIKVTPKVPKRYIGVVTLKKMIPNYSVKKLIELMKNK